MRKLAIAALLAIVGLSGCVVVPAYDPGYRYYRHGYYDRGYYDRGYYDPGYTYYGSGYPRRGYRSY